MGNVPIKRCKRCDDVVSEISWTAFLVPFLPLALLLSGGRYCRNCLREIRDLEAEQQRKEEERRREKRKREEEEKRRQEEERRRKEEERRRQAEERRKKEERRRQEEERRRQEEDKRRQERKRQEEERRKQEERSKQEERRRREEGRQKQEEERRRQEEERRKQEEERRTQEEERLKQAMRWRQEEERRRQEDDKRRQERKRQEEERRKQEERSKQEERRRREEGRQKQEEERRRQEEERRKQEEERRTQEEERLKQAMRWRQEEERRRQEEDKRRQERKRQEEERRKQEERLKQAMKWRQEEERKRQEEERQKQEERLKQAMKWRQEKERKRQEEERRRQEEERWRQAEERRKKEERKRQEEERRRQEEERRTQEERRRQEEDTRRQEERKRQEEERRKQEERRRQEEDTRRQEERKRQEEERRKQEERRRQEEDTRRQEERKRQEEERRTQEERRRQEEERKRQAEVRKKQEEEKRRQEEIRRGEALNQRLEESLGRALEQQDVELSSKVSEEFESKQDVLKMTLNEFELNDESDGGTDELLEIISMKCDISLHGLCLSQLTSDDLQSILSALDTLLFDEWVTAQPSLSTLQHTHVFITELCANSLQSAEGVVLQSVSKHVQDLVDSISQSACSVYESFLLSQALFLTLTHFLSECSDCDVVLMAKQWAEGELSLEDVFIIEFLSTLMSSLQTSVERVTVFILKMEIQSLKLLLNTISNIRETFSESTQRLFKLVQVNHWTPVEAMSLFTELSMKYSEESLSKVLTLVQVHELPPGWTDESGCSLIHALASAHPHGSYEDFQRSLRQKDESSLSEELTELKNSWNLEDSVTGMIKNIVTGVLQDLENAKDEPFSKDSFKELTLDADDLTKCLHYLCRAVFDSKGWWPTVRMMLRWCALVLTRRGAAVELVGAEADSCVTAMISAVQVLMGNKVDIMLSSDRQPEDRAEEWSDFYKYLGLTVDTSTSKSNTPSKDIFGADILHWTISDFVSECIQQGIEVIKTGSTRQSRHFIFEEKSLTSSMDRELSKLKDYESGVILQSLMGKIPSEDTELRHGFIKALFQVLHSNLNKDDSSNSKVLRVSQKINGKELPVTEVFILTSLEKLLKEVTLETESEENRTSAGRWCLEMLFSCVERIEPSTTAELLRMVSDLEAQRLWSAAESLDLLAALMDHHYDNGCMNIMKILHLMLTYQVSSQWMDDKEQNLLKLVGRYRTKDLIKHLEKSLQNEKAKSADALFDELRQMADVDEQTLNKSYRVVALVSELIRTGEIKKHTDVQRARALSHSRETEDLQQVLAVICNAVNATGEGWWPRDTQMISWCLLALSDTGRLLEMSTGEGKSCVIAMFAVLRVLQGEKVDVVSSSSVLCQRDAEDWKNFYEYFNMTADSNTDKFDDTDRKKCYQKDVVYGTIEAFAADHLRQIFEMKDVRPDRQYQCIIIDEVDSLLLDQGVQLTYLSSPMVSMQHLNIILTMIWGHVSQYGVLSAEHRTFVQSPPASFFKAIFDSLDTEGSDINDPMDILKIAEETSTVEKGFTEEFCQSEKDDLLKKLKTVSQDAMVHFFQKIEDYVPYGFTVYTLDHQGLLCLRKSSPYNDKDIPELRFLVLDEGLCCTLYDSEEDLIKPIADMILQTVQYTPCEDDRTKINIPRFLRDLIEKKVSVWVQNAFLAKKLGEGREYVITNDSVCPVDFRSTGIVELTKKWGDGLQQFIEIKHQVKLSTISMVTNYVSNISFFEMYCGKIYGTTGTLGSKADILFLQELHPNLSACKIPTFNRRKLFELKGTLTDSPASPDEWKSEIKRVVLDQISPKSYRGGRAALVICETINKAEEIHEGLKDSIQGEIILYCRSDEDSLSKIDHELHPGDVIVATNLAGRGTDIKVSKMVNNNGGLFVVLSFLSENTRVELQAFGRTARKGKPGSAQIIMSAKDQLQSARPPSSLEEAKDTRDQLATEKHNRMMEDIKELRLREELFSDYCKTLQEICSSTDGSERKAVVAILNEYWGIWQQIKSEDIEQLKRNDLKRSLRKDLALAKSQCQSQTSPCSSIYHYIKFANLALNERQWEESSTLFEKAMQQDKSWAAVAFYSHAYCTIMLKKKDYLRKARDDLQKAQESLKYLNEEFLVCLQMAKMSSPTNKDQTLLEKQLLNKQEMLHCLEKNITEAIQMLDKIKEEGRDAVAKKSSIFSLVSSDDAKFEEEATNLFRQGLQYVFSVEKEPRFPWGALLTFLIGAAEIIGGALLTAFTCGAFASIGMGLISEGISDCISAVESMVKGDFSWKEWAIGKAISIGVSIVGCGIGKLISKGFQAAKNALSKVGKQLKSLPKFLSRQAKEGCSVVAKTNMKNAAVFTVKKMAEELVFYGLVKIKEEVLKQILDHIENTVKENISNDVRSKLKGQELDSLLNTIILSHVPDEGQLQDLLEDKDRKSKLLNIFRELSNTAVQPFYADLGLLTKLNSSLCSVIDKVKAETKGNAKKILTAIQLVHMGTMATDATVAVLSFSNKFFLNLQGQLRTFKEKCVSTDEKEKCVSTEEKKKCVSTDEKEKHPTPQDSEMMKEFKQELADIISSLMAAALVEVFHQKFSSHLVSCIQSKVHDVISSHVRSALKTGRTEELLRAGQNINYIRNMPVCLDSNHHGGEASELSKSHAEKIRDQQTIGTILDLRVLSETTGTKVVILTENSQGKLTTMQELNPTSSPAGEKVTLIYRPKSDRYPDGHYDVLINNQTVSIDSNGRNCLFHALARGMNPHASEAEITSKADRLRHVEAEALLRHPGQWGPFIKKKEWTESIRGGDWYLAKGSGKKGERVEEKLEPLKKWVGEVGLYKTLRKHEDENPGLGQFLNADHQPPKSCIVDALKLNQNSEFAKAMAEVGTKPSHVGNNLIEEVKRNRGSELPSIFVPTEVHGEFPSTRTPDFRKLLSASMAKNEVVKAFKLTILGSMVRFRLNSNEGFNPLTSDFSNTRLSVFEESFSNHSKKMVETWYNGLKDKGVMTQDHLNTITTWIDNRGYNDQNDPHREMVSKCLPLKGGKRSRSSKTSEKKTKMTKKRK